MTMNNNKPHVSIGLPVYNGERFLGETLDSLLAQTFSDFELIVSDNASRDKTEEICREYAARDNRIRYFRNNENKGAAFNHNRVFELSQGEYFKWVSADDVYKPDFLLKCVEALDRYPSIILAYTRSSNIDENGKILNDNTFNLRVDSPKPHERFHDFILIDHNCNAIFGLIRRSVLSKTKLMGNFASADRVLVAQLGLMGKFYEVPEFLLHWRRHKASFSMTHTWYTGSGWWDTEKKGQVVFPAWRIVGEYIKAVRRSPLKLGQKLHCYLHVYNWTRRYEGRMKEDLRMYFKHLRNPDLELYKANHSLKEQ